MGRDGGSGGTESWITSLYPSFRGSIENVGAECHRPVRPRFASRNDGALDEQPPVLHRDLRRSVRERSAGGTVCTVTNTLRRILCVDDDPNVPAGLRRTLRRTYDVTIALSALIALIALIVVDA
jgi:hypothetical protein